MGDCVPGVEIGECEWEVGCERRENMDVTIGAVVDVA